MAIGDYYIDIPSFPEIRPNQEMKFDSVTLKYQTEEAPDVYDNVDGMVNQSIVISAPAVTAIANGSGTITQKRNAVIDLVAEQVKSRGVVESDQARRAFITLLPGETWPVGGYPNIKIDLSLT